LAKLNVYGISDFISLIEWFSSTKTSTLVTTFEPAGGAGERAGPEVGASGVPVPAVLVDAGDDVAAGGVAVAHPDAPQAKMAAIATPQATALVGLVMALRPLASMAPVNLAGPTCGALGSQLEPLLATSVSCP
jgi:hypothetical protein